MYSFGVLSVTLFCDLPVPIMWVRKPAIFGQDIYPLLSHYRVLWLLKLWFPSDCVFQILLRDVHEFQLSIQFSDNLCTFCICHYISLRTCIHHYRNKERPKASSEYISLNNTDLKMLHNWNSQTLSILSSENTFCD